MRRAWCFTQTSGGRRLPRLRLRGFSSWLVATAISNISLILGQRGSRQQPLGKLLRSDGAEAHLVVNNNAAAVLLALAGLCQGREVVVRGELVEIGGSFRVPDVMRASGAFCGKWVRPTEPIREITYLRREKRPQRI